MPTNPRKHQKQQERRAQKRKAKHHDIVRAKSAGLPARLRAAAVYPVLDSWESEALWDQGMGWVGLSRLLPSGDVAFAIFLIDRYCLGVKNAMYHIGHRSSYDERVTRGVRRQFATRDVPPEYARKLVEDAVAYGRQLGFSPHPDYETGKLIFGDIDAGACSETFEFGQKGKPHFIAGPNDGLQRCRRILKTLEQTCGVGGFHYTIPFASDGEVLPGSLQPGDVQILGPEMSDDEFFDDDDEEV